MFLGKIKTVSFALKAGFKESNLVTSKISSKDKSK